MYTEDEARKKWCPSARVCVDGFTSNKFHETHEGYKHANCMASDCMEWRWSENDKGESKIKRTKPDKSCPTCAGRGDGCDECDHTGFIGEFTPLGYCGLGGAPRG